MALTDAAPPDSFVPSTTVDWTSSFADYPASAGWTATFYLRGISQFASGTGVAATPVGATFQFSLSTSQTTLLEGGYSWQIIVTKAGGETRLAADGVLAVLTPTVGAAAGSGSFLEELLAVIEAAIMKRITADMESYQIGDRSVTKIEAEKLWEMRADIKNKLWRERNPGRLASSVIQFSGSRGR